MAPRSSGLCFHSCPRFGGRTLCNRGLPLNVPQGRGDLQRCRRARGSCSPGNALVFGAGTKGRPARQCPCLQTHEHSTGVTWAPRGAGVIGPVEKVPHTNLPFMWIV